MRSIIIVTIGLIVAGLKLGDFLYEILFIDN